MRKLASIQKIKELSPIEGADSIERASVLGWHLVVKKGEFKVGDLVVYCEVDSLLPDKPEFEFLRSKKFIIKTIRLRGQVSMGICFPLSILPPDFEVVEDAECTEVLNITKWEPPIPACLGGKVKGRFPSFIPKTDETRVQVLQELLDKYEGELFYITEKLDGSSTTYYVRDGEFGVCSRNLELLEDDTNSLWKVARELDIESKMKSLGRNISFQGELVGESIQKNKLAIKGQTVRFFNIFDIDQYKYLDFEEFKSIIGDLGLETVPILDENFVMINDIDKLVEMAMVKSVINDKAWIEGKVFRPLKETRDMDGRVSFKAINPEFLLKFKE